MWKLLLLSAVCAVASAKPQSPTEPSAPGPVTVTPAGAVRGSWMDSRLGRRFQAYRGIRYAQPPVGELRFQPPVDMEEYSSEVDASEEGPGCPQPERPGKYPMDEDCLRLNVYTPDNNSSRKLPVVVFIHPGGFYSFAGRSDLFGPHYLLDRDLVLVTLNYRLASLGFLATGDAVAPGNNGYKDQVSALRWVQRNIAAFGGDPNKVTISGCSAGSRSVILHMISPMSKGLFHQGIAMSGSPVGKVAVPTQQFELAQKQAALLNCPTNTSRAIVDCLKTKTWQEIGNSLNGFWSGSSDAVSFWTAIVEPDVGQPRFLPVQPDEAVRQGQFQAVPLLISQTEGEFFWKAFAVTQNQTRRDLMNSEWETIAPESFSLPEENSAAASHRLRQAYLDDKPIEDTPESSEALGKLYGDSWIGLNVHRMANLLCRHSSQPVWYSAFSYVGNNSFYQDPTTHKPRGAAHHDDTIYVFSQSYLRPPIQARSPPPPAPQDHLMVERMTAIWYTFAKYGDPNPREGELPELSSLHWPAMKPEDRKYLKVDRQFSVHEKLHEDRLQVWDEIYPMQY
ncbi:juvenile hormone esterase-like isoform X2 [Leguminivora glycinivorella]|uniref:juvenile hormone esterase-like isoform X2 n=1 Tax=Leguminivora glycinivorella TaxID=1035111 RepID=UPI00200E156E|nr:juvenile hormone esterase-like isoform X2 [Leguminivora glycinivorella]